MRLAADQVVGLDGGGALVNGQDARIPVKLRRAGFLDEAHAAMHLNAQRRNLYRGLGRVALHDGHHVLVERAVARALFRVGVMRALVVRRGRHVRHGAGRFRQGLHGQQHALHIGMAHDGNRRGGPFHRTPLHTLARVRQRMLVRTFRHANALLAHRKPRGIHHDEHVLKATVQFADLITHRALADFALARAVQQHRRRAAMDAQLVFQRRAPDVVALAQAAVRFDQELGHDE
ncbi:hypothetical protein D3C71_1043580 [compost metagenome]